MTYNMQTVHVKVSRIVAFIRLSLDTVTMNTAGQSSGIIASACLLQALLQGWLGGFGVL